jgi:hypothetical protein
MQLTSIEQHELDQAIQLIESMKRYPLLNKSQLPVDLVLQLMSSDQPDLAMIGCYLASRADASVDLSPIEENSASSRNYARLLLAEQPLDYLLSVGRTSSFRENAFNLSQAIPTISETHAANPSNSLTIIVHGTWAKTSRWWQQGGNFWNYINALVPDLYNGSAPYSWSGANSDTERVSAATDLIAWVQRNPTHSLRIIAHSHGGNICLLAAQSGLKIDKLITLGTPIRLEYLPDLKHIGVLHNVFSTNDSVQTPTGTIPNTRGEGRTFGENNIVQNHRAIDDGNGGQPGHSELHEPSTWQASKLYALL